MLAKDSIRLSTLRAEKAGFFVSRNPKGATALDELAKQKIIQNFETAQRRCQNISTTKSIDLASDELAQADVLQSFCQSN